MTKDGFSFAESPNTANSVHKIQQAALSDLGCVSVDNRVVQFESNMPHEAAISDPLTLKTFQDARSRIYLGQVLLGTSIFLEISKILFNNLLKSPEPSANPSELRLSKAPGLAAGSGRLLAR